MVVRRDSRHRWCLRPREMGERSRPHHHRDRVPPRRLGPDWIERCGGEQRPRQGRTVGCGSRGAPVGSAARIRYCDRWCVGLDNCPARRRWHADGGHRHNAKRCRTRTCQMGDVRCLHRGARVLLRSLRGDGRRHRFGDHHHFRYRGDSDGIALPSQPEVEHPAQHARSLSQCCGSDRRG